MLILYSGFDNSCLLQIGYANAQVHISTDSEARNVVLLIFWFHTQDTRILCANRLKQNTSENQNSLQLILYKSNAT